MTAQINIYNPADLGTPMGQYHHVARVMVDRLVKEP